MTDKTMTKAAAKADLPPTVVLMHAQTIHSVDEPGMIATSFPGFVTLMAGLGADIS